ncbi:hypothetical protein MMC26_003244 [Xylographa opegraphella]|nr:hypothetical protein [Xylographa opegraphella]
MPSGYCSDIWRDWASLQRITQGKDSVVVDGKSLTVPAVIAVSRYRTQPSMTTDPDILAAVQASVDLLNTHLQQGYIVYGVNTGVGGSADTRTAHLQNLQKSVIQHQNAGVLLHSDKGLPTPAGSGLAAGLGQDLTSHALPVPVVRAMMLLRCNSLMRGHSGVQICVIESILSLLAYDLTPVVPLRGSISASGDLSPLSYIAGVLEGNEDIYVRSGIQHDYQIITADRALLIAKLQRIVLGPKEALGLLNGTATSCAAASSVIYEAQHMGVIAQVLTAMGTEALLGTNHNHHPFIASTRPHPGQLEAAANIFAFLSDSRLTADANPKKAGMAQDRYSLRTASQWIGPQLEDLALAKEQVRCELNSTTDNPLIDAANDMIYHGGNFQAASVTSAMEKTLTSLQLLGRLFFAQCSELLNVMLNKGLPPNLCADDPSTSFTFKGIDINMAAYMSELGYLAHPVSTHMQSAEMHNQSLNSLALIAARYAAQAIDVVSIMAASYLYALCQALDLRCLHLEFSTLAEPAARSVLRECFSSIVSENNFESMHTEIWTILMEKWLEYASLDLADRGPATALETTGALLSILAKNLATSPDGARNNVLAGIQTYQVRIAESLNEAYDSARKAFFVAPTTPKYLCWASNILYRFVREDLKVPMHRGLVDHPPISSESGETGPKRTIGSLTSIIYMSLRNGELHNKVMEIAGRVD